MVLDLDVLLHHYFGTTELETLDDAAIELGWNGSALPSGPSRSRAAASRSGRCFIRWATRPIPKRPSRRQRERDAAHAYARAAYRAEQP